jgi:hypothetical protein
LNVHVITVPVERLLLQLGKVFQIPHISAA